MLTCSSDFKSKYFFLCITGRCEGLWCHICSLWRGWLCVSCSFIWNVRKRASESKQFWFFLCDYPHWDERLNAVTLRVRFSLFSLPWELEFGKLLCANSLQYHSPSCEIISSPLEALPAAWEGLWVDNGIEGFWDSMRTKGKTREADSLQNPDPSLTLSHGSPRGKVTGRNKTRTKLWIILYN